jgi:lysozyme
MLTNFPAGVPGIDIYHGDFVDSFHLAAAAGVRFVIIKAAQGLTEVDPAHAANLQRALSVGLIAGSYEFFTDGDPVAQAEHFVNNAGLLAGQLPLTLDVETYFPGVSADALACAMEIKRLTGRFPIIYCSLSFWESYLQPIFPEETTLWLAEYGVSAPRVACSFWQWSQGTAVAGITNPCDCDVFIGKLEDLEGMRIG